MLIYTVYVYIYIYIYIYTYIHIYIQVATLLQTVKQVQELNETGVVTAADVAAAAAQAAKDEVEALKAMVETEEGEVHELQRQAHQLRRRHEALQAETQELHARRLAMQNKINSGDVPPDLESIREITDHISSLEAAKSAMIKKLESSGM